jgi:hypothetical protein
MKLDSFEMCERVYNGMWRDNKILSDYYYAIGYDILALSWSIYAEYIEERIWVLHEGRYNEPEHHNFRPDTDLMHSRFKAGQEFVGALHRGEYGVKYKYSDQSFLIDNILEQHEQWLEKYPHMRGADERLPFDVWWRDVGVKKFGEESPVFG